MSIVRISLAVLVVPCVILSACNNDGGGGEGAQGTQGTTNASTGADDNPSSGPDQTTAASVDTTAGASDTIEPTTTGQTSANPDSTGPGADLVAFRLTSLYARDPHFFVGNSLLGCHDITDEDASILTVDVQSVNGQFNEAINTDDPEGPDGVLDLSLLLIFRPLDQADGAMGNMDFANGSCLIPAEATVCDLREGTELQPAMYTSQAAGTCQAPVAAELSSENYSPEPGSTTGPCFLAGPSSVTIATSFASLPLEMATVAGQYVGDPADGVVQGTLRGFLSTTAAESVMLPRQFQALVQTVSDLLPGGEGCCAEHSDLDGDGWWFYADFEAEVAPWNGG